MSAQVFIGWDPVDALMAEVCASSIRRHSDLRVRMLKADDPDVRAVYSRGYTVKNGQKFDQIDGKPFSTDFSFRRFLVPYLCGHKGFAIFCDADIVFTTDLDQLIDYAITQPEHAMWCVKHNHDPENTEKMHGVEQTKYRRKNWSSLVLWNCGHPSNRILTPHEVNTRPGAWLHGFDWLHDNLIGELPETWNWLCGHSPTTGGSSLDGSHPALRDYPNGIHYTDGAPCMANWGSVEFAGYFWDECEDFWWEGRSE